MSERLAVLTGATGSIGRVILEHLVAANYRVIAYGRDGARLAALVAAYPGQVRPSCCDFVTTTAAEMEAVVARSMAALPPLDLLVCAHGAAPCTTPTLELTEVQIAHIIQVDVRGTFLMAQAVGRCMVAQRAGAMVLLSSAHAYQTYPARAGYAMAKAAVCSLARALAVEWGPYNVRVNSISPWQVASQRGEAIAAQERREKDIDTVELYRQRSPLRRLVTAEDVAKTVVFLAQNESMTGQDIVMDCGQSASMWHQGFRL